MLAERGKIRTVSAATNLAVGSSKVADSTVGLGKQRFEARPDVGVSLCGLLIRLFDDMCMSRPSVVLLVVFWPFALFCMAVAQIKRVLLLGSTRSNISHLVSADSRVMNPVLSLSASEMGRRIRLPGDDPKKLTSAGIVEMCITQIRLANSDLLAVVAERFDAARSEAVAADCAIANGTAPDHAFFGVPMVIKECFEMPGFPYTGGLVGRRDCTGVAMTPAIQQLQNAGVIILCSTNISEACMWHESINNVYGTTNNPYDFGRTAGGSSGGVAAAVSSCMAPAGVSSDVGGSTRIPALYNGIFGHKPTGGAISNALTFPSCGTGAIQRYCQLGPSCRRAEDLWPMLRVLLKRDQDDSSPLYPVRLTPPDKVDMKSVIVYDFCSNLGNGLLLSGLHPDQVRAQNTAVMALKDSGATIEYIDIPELSEGLTAFSVWSAMMDRESPQYFDEIIRENMGSMFAPRELLKSLFGVSPHTPPAMLLAIAQRVAALAPHHAGKLCLVGDKLRDKLHCLLQSTEQLDCDEKHHVIVMPSLPCTAPMHMESLFRIFDTSNTAFFNAMELPVTAIPMGLSPSTGLPTGIQVVSAHGFDFVGISVAKFLEDSGVAGWKPPISESNHIYF